MMSGGARGMGAPMKDAKKESFEFHSNMGNRKKQINVMKLFSFSFFSPFGQIK